MDVARILDQLRLERDQIEEAILSLERLASGQEKRRGRPPKWMVEAKKRARAQARKMESPGRTAAA
jgi:ABC-type transporter Mla subunit MlaD